MSGIKALARPEILAMQPYQSARGTAAAEPGPGPDSRGSRTGAPGPAARSSPSPAPRWVAESCSNRTV